MMKRDFSNWRAGQLFRRNGTDLPKSVDEAVSVFIAALSEWDKEQFKNQSYAELSYMHNIYGARIRDDLGLWLGGNTEGLRVVNNANSSINSLRLVQEVWRKLNGC